MAYVHIRKGDRDRATAELKTYLEKAPKGDQTAHAQALLEKLKSGS
jgi:TolA-binding protein